MNISLSLYRIRIGCFATVASRIKAGKEIDLIFIVFVNLFMMFKSNAIPFILLIELMYSNKQCPTSNQYVYTSNDKCAAWFHYSCASKETSCKYCANTASLIKAHLCYIFMFHCCHVYFNHNKFKVSVCNYENSFTFVFRCRTEPGAVA